MTRCVTFLERLKHAVGAPPELAAARVSLGLMIANVAVFVSQIAYARDLHAMAGMRESVMLAFGANYTPFVIHELRLETLMTSCFLHFSLMHIAFNVYALRQVGPFVERTVGAARFFSMYVVSGLVGAASSAAWGFVTGPERMSAGASGAICGVIGTALVLGARVQGWRGPLVRSMGFWLALTIGLGVFIGSDNAAHVGGALTGAIFAAAWKRGVVYTRTAQRIVMSACGGIIALSFVVVAARDLTDPWATLDTDDRITRAEGAYELGSCADTIRATERAARIAPRDPRVLNLKRKIIRGCSN